jgi:hypothetical protein
LTPIGDKAIVLRQISFSIFHFPFDILHLSLPLGGPNVHWPIPEAMTNAKYQMENGKLPIPAGIEV